MRILLEASMICKTIINGNLPEKKLLFSFKVYSYGYLSRAKNRLKTII